MVNRQPPLYIITGIIIGIVFGLLYAWLWIPVDEFDSQPITLQENYKDEYRILIAVSYIANGDLERAKARLGLLGDTDTVKSLKMLAQRTLGEVGDSEQARALGLLSSHLEGDLLGTDIVLLTTETSVSQPDVTELSKTPIFENQTEESNRVTETITISPTFFPTVTPLPTDIAVFELRPPESVCSQDVDTPILKIYVTDSANRGVSGIEIEISWDDGNSQNILFTGLKPDLGPGYADFEMSPNINYSVQISGYSSSQIDLIAKNCEIEGETYWETWVINYAQP